MNFDGIISLLNAGLLTKFGKPYLRERFIFGVLVNKTIAFSDLSV